MNSSGNSVFGLPQPDRRAPSRLTHLERRVDSLEQRVVDLERILRMIGVNNDLHEVRMQFTPEEWYGK